MSDKTVQGAGMLTKVARLPNMERCCFARDKCVRLIVFLNVMKKGNYS